MLNIFLYLFILIFASICKNGNHPYHVIHHNIKRYDKSNNNNTMNISSFEEKYPIVSIICCTARIQNIKNVINNFKRQTYNNLELLIMVDGFFQKARLKKLQDKKNISLEIISYSSVGRCLDFAQQKSKGTLIAKFDDDDYYGSKYIEKLVEEQKNTQAGLLLKLTRFAYFEKNHQP